VSASRRVVRLTSAAPSRASSRASRFETIAGDSPTARPAAERLPLSTILANSA